MLYAMLAVSSTLILVLAVSRAAEARRLARFFRAQREWAELMERHEEEKMDVTDIDRVRGEGASGTCT